jgi:hypothetical protein
MAASIIKGAPKMSDGVQQQLYEPRTEAAASSIPATVCPSDGAVSQERVSF